MQKSDDANEETDFVLMYSQGVEKMKGNSKNRFGKLKKFVKNHKFLSAVIILLLIMFWVIGGIAFSIFKDIVGIVPADKVDNTAANVDIAQTDQKDKDVYNVLLVGTDSRDPNADIGRSDSMMLVSYNQKDGKATIISFLRDTLVDIPGHGKSRLGHTYAYGGVGLTINTLNQTFDLDIQNYITISFENLVNVIDEMGGIELYISAEEAEYYRSNGMPDIQEGNVNMSGSQALAHARNRTLGSDFERTRRQRSVMYGVYNKLLQERNPEAIVSLATYCMTQVNTNMSVGDITTMALDVLSTEHLMTQQASIPYEGMYQSINYEGMAVLEIDLEANKEKINELLY